MDVVQVAVQVAVETVTKAVDVMSRKMSALIKTKMDEKQDKETGKGLSTNDFTNAYKATLDNAVTGVKGDKEDTYRSGNVNITPANIGAVPVSSVGTANGVAELDTNGKVLSSQLPSYVDDVLEYASVSAFPATGESGKIYVSTDTNLSYRWTGSGYVEISPSLALGETSSTAYRGDRGKTAYDHAQTTGNAHNMVKADIGLGNVDNTSDANKPVSTAQQAALDLKQNKETGKGLSTNDYTNADKAKVAAALTEHQDISGKVDKVSGKGLSTNDYTDADKNKLSGIPADANHTTIDVTLSNAGQAADAKITGDSLSALQSLISRMEIYCEASGNPATFYDADAANVKALSVTLTPTQSGSGNPYPPGGGKNLFNYDAWKNLNIVNGTAVFENNGVTLTANTNDCYTAYANIGFPTSARIPVSEGETIILSLEYGTNTRGEIMFFPNGTTNGLVYSSEGDTSLAYTVPSGVTYVTFRVGFKGQAGNTISFRNIMVRRGSDTDPTFEPYSNIRPISGVSSVSATRTGENGANPQTVTVQLTDGSNPLTVYGGTLNVTTGALTVTHANIASYNGETLPGRWISDRDVYASGTTPTTGAQVVYELATPLTYQLTPQQLATLRGYNAVSADTGSVDVTYKVDNALIPLGGIV